MIVLSPQDLHALELFFFEWAQVLIPVWVPDPLLSYLVSGACGSGGRGDLEGHLQISPSVTLLHLRQRTN
jgi:hypothetical protein